MYFERNSSAWAVNAMVMGDFRTHSLAASRNSLVGTTELFEDSSGKMHAIWTELLDPNDAFANTAIVHAIETIAGSANFLQSNLSFSSSSSGGFQRSSINWMRLAEADFGGLFYVGSSYDKCVCLPTHPQPPPHTSPLSPALSLSPLPVLRPLSHPFLC